MNELLPKLLQLWLSVVIITSFYYQEVNLYLFKTYIYKIYLVMTLIELLPKASFLFCFQRSTRVQTNIGRFNSSHYLDYKTPS